MAKRLGRQSFVRLFKSATADNPEKNICWTWSLVDINSGVSRDRIWGPEMPGRELHQLVNFVKHILGVTRNKRTVKPGVQHICADATPATSRMGRAVTTGWTREVVWVNMTGQS